MADAAERRLTTASAGRSPRTKAGRIAADLREAIVSGEIEKGTRLYQDELAARFSTSITPVREALRQLHAEGLVALESHRGVTVSAPDVEQITGTYVLRRLIEPFAVERAAARLSRQDFARAGRINEQLLAAQTGGDQQLARRLNREFHFLFYDACGLPTVTAEIARLWAGVPWSELHVVRGDESCREHERILAAVVADDGDAIRELLVRHIENGWRALVDRLGFHGDDPFAERAAASG